MYEISVPWTNEYLVWQSDSLSDDSLLCIQHVMSVCALCTDLCCCHCNTVHYGKAEQSHLTHWITCYITGLHTDVLFPPSTPCHCSPVLSLPLILFFSLSLSLHLVNNECVLEAESCFLSLITHSLWCQTNHSHIAMLTMMRLSVCKCVCHFLFSVLASVVYVSECVCVYTSLTVTLIILTLSLYTLDTLRCACVCIWKGYTARLTGIKMKLLLFNCSTLFISMWTLSHVTNVTGCRSRNIFIKATFMNIFCFKKQSWE